MTEKEINPEESLAVIHSMISTARNRLASNGFLFIFWGWLILFGALAHYYLILINFEYAYAAWLVTPFGAVVSIIYGIRQKRQVTVTTYIDKYLAFTWGGFFLTLTIALSYMPLYGMKTIYFFVMLLYGIATFISGGILNFKPLIFGSLFAFLFAGVSGLIGENEQLLLLSGCMLFSYILPGHLLRYKYLS